MLNLALVSRRDAYNLPYLAENSMKALDISLCSSSFANSARLRTGEADCSERRANIRTEKIAKAEMAKEKRNTQFLLMFIYVSGYLLYYYYLNYLHSDLV